MESSAINLEITESATALERNEVLDTLKKFRELGYSLSLDDFGTGYSNLLRILGSKYAYIKIDKNILWNLTDGDENVTVLKSLMGFIKGLGAEIVQEGVETKRPLDAVIECGTDYVQGYYFSKPVPENEFFEYLDRAKAKNIAL